MLNQPTVDKLRALKLDALAQAFVEQQSRPEVCALSFEERLGLLVDAQYLSVHNRRLARALREAKLRIGSATLDALDAPESRNLERAQLLQLRGGQYIAQHLSVLITGATGTGKTYLSCALGEQACGLDPIP